MQEHRQQPSENEGGSQLGRAPTQFEYFEMFLKINAQILM
jgi:hypothetical protein